jgi:uncharacterized protein
MSDAPKKPRGFAAMTPEQRREIATRGGLGLQASGKAHRYTSEEAQAAGRKGGRTTAQDREHMRNIGRKGGQSKNRD